MKIDRNTQIAFGQSVIYALHNNKGETFYIGSSKRPKERLREHSKRYGDITATILIVLDGDNRYREEEKIIKTFLSEGHPLINIVHNKDGSAGDGGASERRIFSISNEKL